MFLSSFHLPLRASHVEIFDYISVFYRIPNYKPILNGIMLKYVIMDHYNVFFLRNVCVAIIDLLRFYYGNSPEKNSFSGKAKLKIFIFRSV